MIIFYCVVCDGLHEVEESTIIFRTAFRAVASGKILNVGCCKAQQVVERIVQTNPL